MLKPQDLFDLTHSIAGEWLGGFDLPWEALSEIGEMIVRLGGSLSPDEYAQPAANVWIHRSAKVAASAFLGAPLIIGPETEVRHCAFIRGSALVGAGCVVGNSAELKNAILFDRVQVPHFNYVGDSILGYRAHMGAGAVTSNVKSDKTPVGIRTEQGIIQTGRKKFGALLGDSVEVGCNSVLNPGTVIGRGSRVYPLSCVRGYIPPHHIHKNDGSLVPIR